MAIIIANPYKKIDWRRDGFKKPWLGHRYWRGKGLPIDGDKRCLVCGKWFSWSIKNKNKYILEHRWDFRRNEPIHCGSEHCQEWWRRYKISEKQKIKELNEYYERLFLKLKKQKLVR